MSRFGLTLAIVLGGCGGLVDVPPGPTAPGHGTVSEPAHGAVLDGDPRSLQVHVAGMAPGQAQVSIQVLSNPDDLASWTDVGTAAPDTSGRFATDVQPSQAGAGAWPRGGVLRLRVLDDSSDALPDVAGTSDAGVIAVTNPSTPPSSWTFLTELPTGSTTETDAYYQAIQAPATLDAFEAKYGFPTDETNVRYFNEGDLGIGRDMHCKAVTGGGMACYVRNYGTFGGDQTEAIDALVQAGVPLATVVMVYQPPITAPNAVQFLVYNGNGDLTNNAQLDTHGDDVSIPQNCLQCHGGRSSYDAGTHAASNARFLPFDPAAFVFPTTGGFGFANQADKLATLNQLVMPGATTAEQELITGMYPSGGFDATFVPAAWAKTPRDALVYRDAIAPYCRSCHTSFAKSASDTAAAFATPDDFRATKASTIQRMCGSGPHGMPVAERTTTRFFASGARGLILSYLDAAGTCAPQ